MGTSEFPSNIEAITVVTRFLTFNMVNNPSFTAQLVPPIPSADRHNWSKQIPWRRLTLEWWPQSKQANPSFKTTIFEWNSRSATTSLSQPSYLSFQSIIFWFYQFEKFITLVQFIILKLSIPKFTVFNLFYIFIDLSCFIFTNFIDFWKLWTKFENKNAFQNPMDISDFGGLFKILMTCWEPKWSWESLKRFKVRFVKKKEKKD